MSNKGRKHTEEWKKQMSVRFSGVRNPMYGKKITDEHRKNLVESHKGQIAWNKGLRVRLNPKGEFKKGSIPWNKNGHHSAESRVKMVKSHSGVKQSPETIAKRILRGEKHYRWIKDRTEALERHALKNGREWKDWRMSIFDRDKYTCQECRASGVYLEPHHIIPIRSDRSKAFDINNGITLCRPCHLKTIWKEEKFIEKYSQAILLKNVPIFLT